MSSQVISTAGRALTPGAVALMLMLCISWGFNQIAVKLVLPDVPPMLQALTRSVGALPVLLIIGWLRGIRFFERDGTLRPGLIAGIIFGIEFVLIYRGLLLTSASRAVVFLYTAPFFVALGSYLFLGERPRASQWAGLGLSFAGVALAIGVPQANVDANVLLGDLLIVAGGALWAATTLLVKATALINGPRRKRPGLPGRDVDSNSRPGRMDIRRTDHPRSQRTVAFVVVLPGVLGGRIDVHAVVCAGEDLFGKQTVGLHVRHAAVRRRRQLFHHA